MKYIIILTVCLVIVVALLSLKDRECSVDIQKAIDSGGITLD